MAAGQYPGSTFYGASSYNYTAANRPSSNQINKIIHVTQGSWSSAINWLNNSSASVSAHYTVRSADGFVGQSVYEKNIAWHAGNWPYNQTSIGIEHEGYVNDSKWYTDAMYRSSAKLSAYLCKKYGIPMDRAHILGHNEVPYADHTDPGGYWNCTKHMSYVRSYASSPYSQIVDNLTTGRFSAATSVWGASSYSTQRYGLNYRYARPSSTYSPAYFKLNIPTTTKYHVYGWWPASSGYNDRARFYIKTSSGWITKTLSQRLNGGRWAYLGTYSMTAGDYWNVQVDNRSAGTGYIISDAMRVVRA